MTTFWPRRRTMSRATARRWRADDGLVQQPLRPRVGVHDSKSVIETRSAMSTVSSLHLPHTDELVDYVVAARWAYHLSVVASPTLAAVVGYGAGKNPVLRVALHTLWGQKC